MRRILQITIASICLVAGLSVYWFWSAGELRQGLAEWRRQQAQRGLRVAYQNPVIDGFPLTLQLSVDNPSIAAADGWQWRGPSVSGQSRLYFPQRIVISAPGQHRLAFADTIRPRNIHLNARRAQAGLRVDRAGRLVETSLDLGGLTATADREIQASVQQLTTSVSMSTQPDALPGPLHSLRLSAQNLVLRTAALRPFSDTIEALDIRARLFGWTSGAWSSSALARWRELGGRLEIETLTLLWDSLTVSASGSLELDQALRPEGVLDAWWRGLPETIDRLATAGLLTADAALALKLGLLALPTRIAADGSSEIGLPISFQGGRLYLGPVPVTTLRPLA